MRLILFRSVTELRFLLLQLWREKKSVAVEIKPRSSIPSLTTKQWFLKKEPLTLFSNFALLWPNND